MYLTKIIYHMKGDHVKAVNVSILVISLSIIPAIDKTCNYPNGACKHYKSIVCA